ncbi:MAG: MAE_28990/MAE_18760 family HEPN-like nuclease [Bacteroidia bacterium]
MNNVKLIFTERENEIELYYKHVCSFENDTNEILFKILKANMLLMLYNFVEATISNTIDIIRTTIHNDDQTNFDNLKDKIKEQIIKDLQKKNISPENFSKLSSNISNDIIKLSFKKEEISKGNIDNETISNLSKIYGFIVNNSNYKETGHGRKLVSIKDRRNDLAHGTFSFADVGKDYSVQDLEKFKTETIKYVEYILNNVELYLNNKEYRKIG